MKMKEITVEIKKSVNYQSYGATMTATIEEGEDETIVSKTLFAKCRQLCHEQIDIDKIKK